MGKYAVYKKGTCKHSLIWLAAALILISLAASLAVNGQRLALESRSRTLGLLADYDELHRLADSSPELSFSQLLAKAKAQGLTGIVVRERLLSDWQAAGRLAVISGAELQLLRDSRPKDRELPPLLDRSRQELAIKGERTYILTDEYRVFNQIYGLLEAKGRWPAAFEMGDYLGIEVQLTAAEREGGGRGGLGLGYPLEDLQSAADLGLEVIPRVRSWAPVNTESLREECSWISRIPGLSAVGFNDAKVPGSAEAQNSAAWAQLLEPLDIPLISFEFYDQAGLGTLARRLDNRLIRAHAIAENELKNYTDNARALERFSLAASERNIRYIYLHYANMDNPAAALETSLAYTGYIRRGLEDRGFDFGRPAVMEMPAVSYLIKFVIGLGVIACGGWLLGLACRPLAGKKSALTLTLVLAAGVILWGGLLLKRTVLAVKLAALAAAVCFPSLAAVLVLERCRETASDGKPLLRGLLGLLSMSLGTWAGAMILSALLADTAFMLKLDSFMGVKLAHLLPLLLVPAVLWLRAANRSDLWREAAGGNVKFWHLGAGALLLAALAVYILRTGNDAAAAVPAWELRLRQLLTEIFGVRPRTKEFLVGHPLMLILLYFGFSWPRIPLLLLGLVGQVSLINTYAHLHTPLAVSLLRSLNGLALGLALGLGGIMAVKLVQSRLARCAGAQGRGSRSGSRGRQDSRDRQDRRNRRDGERSKTHGQP